MHPSVTSSDTPLVPPVADYVADVARVLGAPAGPVVSLVVFGSAATGGWMASRSDVDLLVVVRDDLTREARAAVMRRVARLEAEHGLEKSSAAERRERSGAVGRVLARFADRLTANVRAFFVLTRSDLLSGEPARILGISLAQARFVDRTVLANILRSGRTVWGEALLDAVPLAPIRRVDVFKSLLGLFGETLFSVATYPLLPGATAYAMDALKRSVHNCYFCHHGRPAPLAEEIAFLEARDGPSPVLRTLLELRRRYEPSFRFTVACLPTLVRQHWRTARLAGFPRPVHVDGVASSNPSVTADVRSRGWDAS